METDSCFFSRSKQPSCLQHQETIQFIHSFIPKNHFSKTTNLFGFVVSCFPLSIPYSLLISSFHTCKNFWAGESQILLHQVEQAHLNLFGGIQSLDNEVFRYCSCSRLSCLNCKCHSTRCHQGNLPHDTFHEKYPFSLTSHLQG